jgi:hypothetical protein
MCPTQHQFISPSTYHLILERLPMPLLLFVLVDNGYERPRLRR